MKLRSTQSQETFTAELTNEHPASVPGPLAIKRAGSDTYIAMRDVLGVADPPYQLLEVSPGERLTLKAAGIIIAENAADLQHWYNQWDGPK